MNATTKVPAKKSAAKKGKPAEPTPVPEPRHPPDIVTFGVLALALIFFFVAVKTTDQDAMNGYGLISVLGWPFFASLFLTCFAAAREFSRRTLRDSHMAAVAVVLIVVLFGIQNLSDSAAGFSTAWLHVGFAQYISDNGQGLQFYDARFSWPGFFGAAASLTSLAGMGDGVTFLRWAPIAYNLLALTPLVLLARHVTSRQHVAWLGVLLYFCANWFEQDYFAPQATNLVLYLITISVLLWLAKTAEPGEDVGVWARIRRWWSDGVRLSIRRLSAAVFHQRPAHAPGTTATQYIALEAMLIVIITASVVSHQLTPVAIILALTAFSVSARTRFKGLWLVAGIIFIGWFSYGATDYWFGHLSNVIGDFGKVGSTVSAGVGERVSGDPAHLHVQLLRLLMSAGFGVLALVGLVIRRKSPYVPLYAALALSPFLILGLQSYGGEVVIRVFLFATPMFVLLAAETVSPIFRWPRQWSAAIVLVILLVAAVLQVAARGANQPYERVTSDDVAAVRVIQSLATSDSVVASFNEFTPLPLIPPKSVGFDSLDSCPQTSTAVFVGTPEVLCASINQPDFIYASSSQAAYGTLVQGKPAGWLDKILAELQATGNYKTIVDTEHVTVLQRITPPPPTTAGTTGASP